MAFKFIVLMAFVVVTSGGLLPAVQETEKAEEYDYNPSYKFSYDVQDVDTGDFKSQSESREGDLVQGQYTLNDADGYRRIVDYSADATSGFRASVRREPLNNVQQAAAAAPLPLVQKPDRIIKPVTYRQPTAIFRSFSAPTLVHHAPAHTLIHTAPTVHLASAAHVVHAAPSLVKSAPATVITHHAPAVVHSSLVTPHYQFHY